MLPLRAVFARAFVFVGALAGCGVPIVPDLVVSLAAGRRRQVPHSALAAAAHVHPTAETATRGATGEMRRSHDVDVRVGLVLRRIPRRAHVDVSPVIPGVRALPDAPECRSTSLARWERLAVERAWLLVVLALGTPAVPVADAQPPQAATNPPQAATNPTNPQQAAINPPQAAINPPPPDGPRAGSASAPARAPAPATTVADSTSGPTADTHVPPADAAAPLEGEALTRAIHARFANEPEVLVVVLEALRAAGLDPTRARRRATRGRRASLLPEVRLGATRQRGVAATSGQTTNDVTTRTGSDDSLRFEANLAFNLGNLVYGPDEVAWSREERAIVDAAASLAREIVELYFRRRRLIVEIELLGEHDVERQIALAEVDALLEVFTGGNFSRMMRERPPP